jgi:hypothetical protein
MSTNTDATANQGGGEGVNYLELTFALMGGPLVWLLRLVVNSSLVEYSCQIGATWPLWLTTTVATLIGVAALATSRRYYRMADDASGHHETAGWLGLLGIMLNVMAVAGIVLESTPIAVLDVCRAVL